MTMKAKLARLPAPYVQRLREAERLVEAHAQDANPQGAVREARSLSDLFGKHPEPPTGA